MIRALTVYALSAYFLATFAWPEIERTRDVWQNLADTLAHALR